MFGPLNEMLSSLQSHYSHGTRGQRLTLAACDPYRRARRRGADRLDLQTLARCRRCDAALQTADLGRQLAVGGIAQKRVDATLVLNCADRRGSNAQPHRAEHVGENACSLQIGQIAPFGLIVGMADIVPDLDSLACDRTSPRHGAPRSD